MKFVLKPDVFPQRFAFWIGKARHKKIEDWAHKLKLVFKGDGLTPIRDVSNACCWDLPFGSLVYMENKPERASDYALLMHEIYHAVENVSRNLGFGPGTEADEFRAYMIQWLSEKCFKKLW